MSLWYITHFFLLSFVASICCQSNMDILCQVSTVYLLINHMWYSQHLVKKKHITLPSANFCSIHLLPIWHGFSSAPSFNRLFVDDQMEMELDEIKRERDLAQSQLDELRKKVNEDQTVRELLSSLAVYFSLRYLNCISSIYSSSGVKSIWNFT